MLEHSGLQERGTRTMVKDLNRCWGIQGRKSQGSDLLASLGEVGRFLSVYWVGLIVMQSGPFKRAVELGKPHC